ncbi:PREDICTED: uncharacterized protein LOC109205966 [Nicotiana attenuata]|uniref:uncharacterized protein LOC109205966 n=1 Tax=Nicotiana attenuata TaxID=49451 RepID=UPI00090541D7|nr:PREDICTED: uncharacterized protein LOC109205966 [Nicotiana attenuata]
MAGIATSLMKNFPCTKWIIDSGATHHIASDLEALEVKDEVNAHSNGQFHLPTGKTANVSHIGKTGILDKVELDDVLSVPEFIFNLFSVSKLTRQLSCSVNFFPDFCLFQDLYNGKVREIVREKGGLYILKKGLKGDLDKFIKGIKQFASTTTKNNEEDGALWHKRLGHASQNGVVERKHRHMLGTARAMKFQASVPTRFWGECVKATIYVINRLPTILVNGRDVVFKEHIFPFAKPASQNHIVEKHTSVDVFVTQPPNNADLQLERIENDSLEESTDQDAMMHIQQLILEKMKQLSDVVQLVTPIRQQSTLPNDVILPTIVELENNEVMKSKRTSKEPLWLQDYVTTKKRQGSSYPLSNYLYYAKLTDKCRRFLANISTLTGPKNFTKASKDKRWTEAMEMKIKALEDNKTRSMLIYQEEKMPLGRNGYTRLSTKPVEK